MQAESQQANPMALRAIKIGNAHLKWAFSEIAVLYLRGQRKAQLPDHSAEANE